MAEGPRFVGPGEARDALASAAEAEAAGRRRGAPPRWLAAVLGLLLGGMMAAPALANAAGPVSEQRASTLLTAALVLVVVSQRERAGVRPQDFPCGPRWTALLVTLGIGFAVALYAGGVALRDADRWWGPVAAGVLAGGLAFVLVDYQRRAMLGPGGRGDAA